MIAAFFARQHEAQIIFKPETDQPLGIGFEITVVRSSPFTGGYRATWTERILVFSSFERALSAAKKLDQAIELAQGELLQLNEHKQGKKTLAVEQIVRACTEIVKRRRVAGLVNFRLETEVSERAVRAWRARPARSKSRTRPTIAAQKTTGTGLEFLCHEPPARALAAATSAPGLARAGQHRTRLWPVNRPPAWLVAIVFEN